MYYTDSLLYGAIVASPEVYECNLKRFNHAFDYIRWIICWDF
jgi:hypothetical protein